MHTQPFCQSHQMIELNFGYFSLQCIWLYDLVMSHSRSEWIRTPYLANVKNLLTQNNRHIQNLMDCNKIGTHDHLVRKGTLNHLAQLTKWLSWIVNTYLFRAFDCIFLSYHVRVSEWIHTLFLPNCQASPFSKQAQYLKFKLLQWNSNPQLFNS